MNVPGVRIRDLREALGWSTLDLARACRMREEYLCDIEAGVILKVHTFTYQKIADALGVTLGVLDGSEELAPNAKLEDEVPSEYLWFVKMTIRAVLVLGTLTLTLIVVAVASGAISWLLGL